ncbi:MAG TPA: hypothetical protein PK867_01655 [Pirellulales bacterium]|nr:hypothetical protein [Pirellulales bacterium]
MTLERMDNFLRTAVSRWRKLCSTLDDRLRRALKNDTYLVVGSLLVRQRGFFACQKVAVRSIQAWTVCHEMVDITLSDETVVRWTDRDGSLIKLLEEHASAERSPKADNR